MSSTSASGLGAKTAATPAVVKAGVGLETTPTPTVVSSRSSLIKPALGFGAAGQMDKGTRSSEETGSLASVERVRNPRFVIKPGSVLGRLRAWNQAKRKAEAEAELAGQPDPKSAKRPTPPPHPVTPSLSETAEATTSPPCPPNRALHIWLRNENDRLVKANKTLVEKQQARNVENAVLVARLENRVWVLERDNEVLKAGKHIQPASSMFTASYSRARPVPFAAVEDTKPTPNFIRPKTVPSLFVAKTDWQTIEGWGEEHHEEDEEEVDEEDEEEAVDDEGTDIVEEAEAVDDEALEDLVEDEDEDDSGWMATSPRGGD